MFFITYVNVLSVPQRSQGTTLNHPTTNVTSGAVRGGELVMDLKIVQLQTDIHAISLRCNEY